MTKWIATTNPTAPVHSQKYTHEYLGDSSLTWRNPHSVTNTKSDSSKFNYISVTTIIAGWVLDKVQTICTQLASCVITVLCLFIIFPMLSVMLDKLRQPHETRKLVADQTRVQVYVCSSSNDKCHRIICYRQEERTGTINFYDITLLQYKC
jgi:hypothetical protein